MDDRHIDGPTASVITDRSEPPKGLAAAPLTINAVLWCLRGLSAPGQEISVSREIIEKRTGAGETAVKKALRILIGYGILIQTERPAPGRVARYRMSYARLADWLDDHDRELVELMVERRHPNRRKSTQAPGAGEQGRDAPGSKSTQARGAQTQARGAQTQARGAGDIKEATALPAKPAAAARKLPPARQQLANLAAAAAAVPDFDVWVQMGKRAGLDRDAAERCADALVQADVQDGPFGRRLLERASERGSSIKDLGAWSSRFIRDGAQDRTGKDRGRENARRKMVEGVDGFTADQADHVRRYMRELLESELGEGIASELMPLGQYATPVRAWDDMLDLMVSRWSDIAQTVAERLHAEHAGAA